MYANHHGHMARANKPIKDHMRIIQQRFDGRWHGDVVAKDAEIGEVLARRLLDRQCGRRGCCLETKPEEHHLAIRVTPRDLKRIKGRIDHADIRAVGLGLQERLAGAGHAHRIPEGGEDHARIFGDLDTFVDKVAEVYDRLGRCQIAVSEGIQDRDGNAIGAMLIQGEADAHGNVQLSGSGALGDQLSNVLKERLKPASGKAPRVRADTLGYLQRCWPDASPIDQDEARRAGRYAANRAASGDLDGSVAIIRTGKGDDGEAYASELDRIELTQVAAQTKHMDPEYMQGDFDISQKFRDYCTPLLGELPTFGRL